MSAEQLINLPRMKQSGSFFFNLRQSYLDCLFSANPLSIVINPFYIIRRGLHNAIIQNRHYLSGALLDFGCGRKPYQKHLSTQKYIGIDLLISAHDHSDEQIDVYYDGCSLPFQNCSFDSVFSSEVFEHVFDIDSTLDELHRILKPSGFMLVTAPFGWEEHEEPNDFARYTSYGLRHILKKHGFEIIVFHKANNYIETLFQMWNAYIWRHVFPQIGLIKLLLSPFFIFPVTLLGIACSRIFPQSKTLYCSNVAIVRKAAAD